MKRYNVWVITPKGATQVGTRLILTLATEAAEAWASESEMIVSVVDAETGQIVARR